MRSIVFAVGVLLSLHAHSEIGRVTEISGTAIIRRGNVSVPVIKGIPVEMNDRVETKTGRAKIIFNDDTTVTVTESSLLIIDDFVYDPKNSSGKLNIRAASGTIRYTSGKIAHDNPNTVKISTPTATIGVRGTDFSMSVDEVGGSMIILMPSCEQSLESIKCGSGVIDVISAGDIVTLDRPYQATIVDSVGSSPSLPMTVNLNGQPIGNNLMLVPPKTSNGIGLSAKKNQNNLIAETSAQESQVKKPQTQHEETQINDVFLPVGIKINNLIHNPYVTKLYKDVSEIHQYGWKYERLGDSGYNYLRILLTNDTKSLIVTSQDGIPDTYNSNEMSQKSFGTIIVNQNYK